MTTHSSSLSRSRLFLVATMFAMTFANVVATGCATQGSASPAVVSNDPVVIEVSDKSVSVFNQTGSPLVNVSVVLLPTQGSPFTKILARVDHQQRTQIAIKDLKTSQGVSFDPKITQGLKVLVSAANEAGQRYEASVPWP